MANEQLLSQFNVPHINGMAAKLILANEVLYNIAQGEIESNGRGVTQKFTTDMSGAQIRVLRILPLKGQARELGSSLNGGNFNTEREFPRSTEVGIDVITVIDFNIDMADVTQDMIPVDIMAANMKNFTNVVNRNINAMTLSGKLGVSLLADDNYITYFDSTVTGDDAAKKEILRAFLDANGKLNEGDEEHDVDIFPLEDRICVTKPAYYTALKYYGILGIGGSNKAQELIASDGITNGKSTDWLGNGYIGDLDGVGVYAAVPAIFTLAEKYAGVPKGEFEKVMGYFSSAMANSRGVATAREMKIIDHPDGQGIRIQPKVRMGFESWYPKGNSLMVDGKEGEFVNPLKAIKELYPAYTFKNKAPGSRVFPILAVTTVAGTSATVVVSYPQNAGTTAAGLYAWSKDAGVKTIGAFHKAYKAAVAAQKGTITSGAAITVPTAAGTYYLHALVVSNDGSISVGESEAVVKA